MQTYKKLDLYKVIERKTVVTPEKTFSDSVLELKRFFNDLKEKSDQYAKAELSKYSDESLSMVTTFLITNAMGLGLGGFVARAIWKPVANKFVPMISDVLKERERLREIEKEEDGIMQEYIDVMNQQDPNYVFPNNRSDLLREAKLWEAQYKELLCSYEKLLDVKTDYFTEQERHLLSSEVYFYFKKIRELLSCHCEVLPEQVFDVVYRTMPNIFVNSFTDCFLLNQSIRHSLLDEAGNYNGSITVEMILKLFMSFAADVEKINQLSFVKIPNSLKVWNKMIERLNKVRDWITGEDDVMDEVIADSIPVSPILLAALWAIMIVGLTEYYCKTDLSDADLKEISKLVLSIVMSLLVGFTGYMHKGGVIGGVTSPTKYFHYVYDGYEAVKDTKLIPAKLRFPALDGFSNLSRELQVSAGEGLNMMYTFRVGDTMLINLEEDKVVSGDSALSILKSLWPLPLMDQVNKMYRLYTEPKIYNL